MWFANIFFPEWHKIFHYLELISFFVGQHFTILIESNISLVSFMEHAFVFMSKIPLPNLSFLLKILWFYIYVWTCAHFKLIFISGKGPDWDLFLLLSLLFMDVLLFKHYSLKLLCCHWIVLAPLWKTTQ